MSADFRQQEELEQERRWVILQALLRVRAGRSTNTDAEFLASELGLQDFYRNHTEKAVTHGNNS